MCRVEDQLKFPTSSYTLDAVSCRDNLNSTKLDFCREGGREGGPSQLSSRPQSAAHTKQFCTVQMPLKRAVVASPFLPFFSL